MKSSRISLFLLIQLLSFLPLALRAQDDATTATQFCDNLQTQYPGLMSVNSSDVDDLLQNDDCTTASNNVDQCCNNPASCIMTMPKGNDNSQPSAGAQIIELLSGVAMQVPGSIAQMCGRMNTVSELTTAINTAMSLRCRGYIVKCSSSCKPKYQQAQSDLHTAEGYKCSPKMLAKLALIANTYQSKMSLCSNANSADFQLAQQAVQSALAQRFSSMCKSQANIAATNSFNTPNCLDATQANTPFCQYECDKPGATSNPACAGAIAQLQAQQAASGFSSLNTSGALGAGAKNMFANVPTQPDPDQTPVFSNGTPIPDSLTKTDVGPAAGGALGGAPLMAGLGVQMAPGGGHAGYDTSILKGVTAGGGFSKPGGHMMAAQSGGFGGYAGSSSVVAKDLWGKFSLKDFLPGGKFGPKQGPVRGLASLVAEVAPAHDDIFEKVTNRFYQVCLRKALYDCDTLKKVRAGN